MFDIRIYYTIFAKSLTYYFTEFTISWLWKLSKSFLLPFPPNSCCLAFCFSLFFRIEHTFRVRQPREQLSDLIPKTCCPYSLLFSWTYSFSGFYCDFGHHLNQSQQLILHFCHVSSLNCYDVEHILINIVICTRVWQGILILISAASYSCFD